MGVDEMILRPVLEIFVAELRDARRVLEERVYDKHLSERAIGGELH